MDYCIDNLFFDIFLTIPVFQSKHFLSLSTSMHAMEIVMEAIDWHYHQNKNIID